MSTPLYTIKSHPGAHILHHVRDTESGTIADVQLVGAPLPFSVPVSDVADYQPATAAPYQAATPGDIIALAQEALTVYALDPGRIARAADLARDPYKVQQAKRDVFGGPIKPTLNNLIVKASKNGWYMVTRGSCTCKDHTRGNVCKHRIAAWMHRESIIRPLAQARRTTTARILAELNA